LEELLCAKLSYGRFSLINSARWRVWE
jgi:hypothetical protein